MMIVPAVLSPNQDDFLQKIQNPAMRTLARLWQIDILDGSLFPEHSFAEPEALLHEFDLPAFELHLMIADPLPMIDRWKQLIPTTQRAIIHAEIEADIPAIIHEIHDMNLEAGIAISPKTSMESIHEYADLIDMVLVMGVHPGKSGQQLLTEFTIPKIQEIKHSFPGLIVGVDGGVKIQNAPGLLHAGADQLCIGSGIWNTNSPALAYQKFASI